VLLLIDNFDSFTHNLARYFTELSVDVEVVRNNALTLDDISRLAPSQLVISPGPCTPNEAGISLSAIEHFAGKIPILGVCLGHQTIAEFFGGNLENLVTVKHGISTKLSVLDSNCIYKNLPNSFYIGHYHSWIVKDLTRDFYITARDETGEIMSFRHKNLKLFGIQYHPESILTEHGTAIMQNWINQTIK